MDEVFNQGYDPPKETGGSNPGPFTRKGIAIMNAKEIHEVLAQQGVRLFALSLGSDRLTYIHSNKTVKDWRADIRNFISEIKPRYQAPPRHKWAS